MEKTIKIKKNDMVKVISGRDKGKQGKVTQVFPVQRLVVVEGINLRTKHLKTRGQGRSGNKVQFAAPLLATKVMVLCPQCSHTTRIKHTLSADNKKMRVCHRCNQSLVVV